MMQARINVRQFASVDPTAGAAVDAGLQSNEAQQLLADLERLLNRKTLEGPHKAELIRKAQTLWLPRDTWRSPAGLF